MLQKTASQRLPDRATDNLCLAINAFARDRGIPQPKIDSVIQAVRSWSEPNNDNLPGLETSMSLATIERPISSTAKGSLKDEQSFLRINGYSAKNAELYLNEIENLIRGILQSDKIDPRNFNLSDPDVAVLITIPVKENVIMIAGLRDNTEDGGVNLIQGNGDHTGKLSLTLTAKAFRIFGE
jgi:hypothetical protein